MSYVNHHVDPSRRVAALATTFAVHGVLGLAVIAGLKVAGVIEVEDKNPEGIFVEVPENIPAPTPTVEPDAPVDSYIPPAAPIPRLPLNNPPIVDVEPVDLSKIPLDLPPRPAPSLKPVPSPPPSFAAVGPVPIGGSGWISTDDYPSLSVRRDEEGML